MLEHSLPPCRNAPRRRQMSPLCRTLLNPDNHWLAHVSQELTTCNLSGTVLIPLSALRPRNPVAAMYCKAGVTHKECAAVLRLHRRKE
jgi:hypothetical protein